MARASRCFRLLTLLALLIVAFPAAHPAFAASIIVSNLNDNGAGSLRDAMTTANGAPGSQITFSVSGAINLLTPLPAIIADGTVIDGAQSGVPKIEVRGNGTVSNGLVVNASNSTIRGLILNGFNNATIGVGVLIDGASRTANGNLIEYCFIGTNAAGSVAGFTQSSNNSVAGIRITHGASTNSVRNNVISGNGGYGIDISSLSTDVAQQNGNILVNNKIGVNNAGTALGNTQSGVLISYNSNNNVVGPDNVISGNGVADGQYGIMILKTNANGSFISNNRVSGNKIGTDPTGKLAIPNRSGGVLVGTSTGTIIGGPDGNPISSNANRGNLISGQTTPNALGVLVQISNVTSEDVTNTVIQNNWIGLDSTGNAALKNDLAGIQLSQGANGVSVTGNVISGNYYGVYLLENTDNPPNKQTRNNTITGNIIGTNAAGTAAVPNGFIGIYFRGGVWGNTVSNNRITGNNGVGIDTDNKTNITPTTNLSPYNNTISGNQVGTLASGAPIGNNASGVGINLELGTNGNIINANNVISGHNGSNGAGILIQGSASANNQISANTLSNNENGIRITSGAHNNLIQKNTVQNNTSDGILVTGAATVANKITQTTTSANGGASGKGIRLASGGNTGLAPPTVSGLSATTTSLAVSVSTTASCASGCTVEVFDATTAENFEGPFYLASFNITGNGAFSVPTSRACQRNLTFTITDPGGNTSEFSAAQAVATCTGTAPQIGGQPQLAPTTATQTGAPGTTVTFQHQLTNVGSVAGTFTIAVGGLPASWNATVSPTTVSLNPGDPAVQVTVTATIPAGTDGGSYVATLSVATQGNSATASAQDTIQVPLTPALTFAPPSQAKSAGAGQNLCYDHTLTNTANGADTFTIFVSAPSGWIPSVQGGTTVSLAKGAAQTVTVCLAIPSGTAPASYATTVTAQSNTAPKPSASATDTTTIIPTAVPQFNAGTTQTSTAGAMIPLAHTLTNIGNATSDFDLAVTLPAGFTLTSAPTQTPPGAIAPSASTTVNYTVQLPAKLVAGDYNITLRATAKDAVGASATVVDVIHIDKIAALALGPNQSSLAKPYTVITYTQTLTNSGNFTDTVKLAATASQGWNARPVPATTTIAPFSSLPINVVVTIPLGQRAGVVNTTFVTATSSLPNVSASARLTTTIDTVAGTLLTPARLTRGVESGKSVTFTFALTNSGSIDQSYNLEALNVPAGWTAQISPLTTGSLVPGAGVPIQLVVTTPPNLPDGTIGNISLKATSSELDKPSATVVARVQVGPPFKVVIDPDNASSGLPGTLVRYTHVITNAGFNDDTIVVSSVSSLGWRTSVVPSNVSLPPFSTAVVTVTVVIPSNSANNAANITTVTARSTGDPTRFDTAVNRTKVLQVAGVDISPGRFSVLALGTTQVFQHTLTNLGNGIDSFTITATQTLNWSIVVTPTQTVPLGSAVGYPIEVRVQIPADAPKNAENHIIIRATSRFDPHVWSELEDIISPIQSQGVVRQLTVYLPLTSRN